uniref:Uncharacterized protein n=1 Tax=Panagrolaimus superbus TaxID=310955 RepID=A0A914YBU4_9BILA
MKQLDVLIDMAEEALAERDVKFDDDGNILQITQKAEQYLEKKSTPEFIRSYAFGQIYRTLLDSHVGIFNTLSIPLLFVIVLQKRYTVLNRRKACAWMRRQLPIVQNEFTPKERLKLSYPINAIE